jgi:hypothetical protein
MNRRLKASFFALVASGFTGCTTGGRDAMETPQQPPMDMMRMCEVHELMMTGTSAEEQQTMLEQHLKAMHGSVDAAMVDRHRRAMAQNCPPGASGRR